jgi:hypothetical protein
MQSAFSQQIQEIFVVFSDPTDADDRLPVHSKIRLLAYKIKMRSHRPVKNAVSTLSYD